MESKIILTLEEYNAFLNEIKDLKEKLACENRQYIEVRGVMTMWRMTIYNPEDQSKKLTELIEEQNDHIKGLRQELSELKERQSKGFFSVLTGKS